MKHRSVIRAAGALLAIALGALSLGPSPALAGQVHWRGIGSFTARGQDEAYELNALNYRDSGWDGVRARVFLDAGVSERVAVFGQFLFDDESAVPMRIYGLYAMFSNFVPTDVHVEVGKIPSVFGTFAPRMYENTNPLIGLPLMYQYHSGVRGNQIPLSAEDLVAASGQGQRGVSYYDASGDPTGASSERLGLPALYLSCWDFGVNVLGTYKRFEYGASITNGTVGSPVGAEDSNGRKGYSGRVGFSPVTGFLVSVSGAFGPYLARDVEPFLPTNTTAQDYQQQALGLSLNWSAGHAMLAAEAVDNRYESPWIDEVLTTRSWYLEGKYTVIPGLYGAVRVDRMDFGDIRVLDSLTLAASEQSWDRDLQRVEGTVGYWPASSVLTRVGLQFWDEDGGSWDVSSTLLAAQAILSF